MSNKKVRLISGCVSCILYNKDIIDENQNCLMNYIGLVENEIFDEIIETVKTQDSSEPDSYYYKFSYCVDRYEIENGLESIKNIELNKSIFKSMAWLDLVPEEENDPTT